MEKVFIINGGIEGGEVFVQSKGTLNKTLTNWTETFLEDKGFEIRVTNVNHDFDPKEETENFVWADFIVFHTPIWWFQLPYKLKEYIDFVFQNGYGTIYKSDGRHRTNPEIDYGKGGLLHGKKYFITTSWNAPEGAFTLKGELMNQTSVDDGVLFGVHKMMEFVGLTKVEGFHFYDVEKNMTLERFTAYEKAYHQHLKEIFGNCKKQIVNSPRNLHFRKIGLG